jgi:hypothetical protein
MLVVRLLAALNPATQFTVMQPPPAKLCSHPVQRYAATKLLIKVFKISSTPKAFGWLSYHPRRRRVAGVHIIDAEGVSVFFERD